MPLLNIGLLVLEQRLFKLSCNEMNMGKVKRKNTVFFWVGLLILAFLLTSYFIPIKVDSGANYMVKDSLLGIIIIHNPFILGIYILIGFIFIANGIKYNWNKHNN